MGRHAPQARAVVEAVSGYDRSLPLLGLPGSSLLRPAEAAGLLEGAGLRVAPFAG